MPVWMRQRFSRNWPTSFSPISRIDKDSPLFQLQRIVFVDACDGGKGVVGDVVLAQELSAHRRGFFVSVLP